MDLQTKYANTSREVEQKLSRLKKILKKHNRCFAKEAYNWGYLADLINLDNRLDDVIHFTRM
jgi:hypothetical protein